MTAPLESGALLPACTQEPGGEYVTINNNFPEDLEFRVPVREKPVASFLFGDGFS